MYISHPDLNPHVIDLLDALHMPQSVRDLGKIPFTLPTAVYQKYWTRAKENISCFPGPLSMATLKAAASDNSLVALKACLTRTPLIFDTLPADGSR